MYTTKHLTAEEYAQLRLFAMKLQSIPAKIMAGRLFVVDIELLAPVRYLFFEWTYQLYYTRTFFSWLDQSSLIYWLPFNLNFRRKMDNLMQLVTAILVQLVLWKKWPKILINDGASTIWHIISFFYRCWMKFFKFIKTNTYSPQSLNTFDAFSQLLLDI